MMVELEKKVYSPWAFTENEWLKSAINREIYNELKAKYKILRLSDIRCPTQEELDNNDIVIYRKACYLRSEYLIYKRPKELTDEEMALICDKGNLCFGYFSRGNVIDVYED